MHKFISWILLLPLMQGMQNPANHPLRPHLLLDLHDMVTEVNGFVGLYKTAHERLLEAGPGQPDVSLSLHFSQHTDHRRYNQPTSQLSLLL
jgi:hypothetical protein